MATNLASKYSQKVDERFKLKSLTEVGVNRDYEWSGVKTVSVFSIPTVAMSNYTRSGAARYGSATELDNAKQDLTLNRDRAFTFTIDRGFYDETLMTLEAGKALARQIDEVVVPEVDSWRLAKMSAAAITNGQVDTLAIDATNAYEAFLAGTEVLSEKKVPEGGRIAFVTPAFYSFLKLDPSFIKSTEIAQKFLVSGQVGELDGVKIIKVPTTYFPANHAFIIAHPAATVAANKLEDYKTHDNPPGINGWLVEGRTIYDAFVLDSKVDAIYVHKTA
jgi:N4-gp56 family major capsid protein